MEEQLEEMLQDRERNLLICSGVSMETSWSWELTGKIGPTSFKDGQRAFDGSWC
jgi:hypothetical protein